MKRVTFKSFYMIKGQAKTSIIIEYTEASDSAIRLRALALNWQLIKIETNYVFN